MTIMMTATKCKWWPWKNGETNDNPEMQVELQVQVMQWDECYVGNEVQKVMTLKAKKPKRESWDEIAAVDLELQRLEGRRKGHQMTDNHRTKCSHCSFNPNSMISDCATFWIFETQFYPLSGSLTLENGRVNYLVPWMLMVSETVSSYFVDFVSISESSQKYSCYYFDIGMQSQCAF